MRRRQVLRSSTAVLCLAAGTHSSAGPQAPGDAAFVSPATGAEYRVEFDPATASKRFLAVDGTSYASVFALLRAEEARRTPAERTVHPDVRAAVDEASAGDGTLDVTLVLRRQPLLARADARRAAFLDDCGRETSRARRILGRIATFRSAPPGDDPSLARADADEASLLSADEKAELETVRSRVAALRAAHRRDLLEGLADETAADQAPLLERLRAIPGTTVLGRSSALSTVSVRIPARLLADVWTDLPDVARVVPHDVLRGALDVSVATIGAGSLNGGAITGSGATIAILDSGVDRMHPALGGRVQAYTTHLAAAALQSDFFDQASNPDDIHGHGTRVAGVAASGDGTYRGAAYGVRLLNAKTGYQSSSGFLLSLAADAFSGADWAADNGADVLNVSLFATGTPNAASGTTLFFDAVAAELGVHVATAAGNSGPGTGSLGLPADGFNVIGVGAFDDGGTTSRSNDAIASFSSRGPTTDGRVKPDLAVPGVSLTTLSATWEGAASDFYTGTGTSAATPHVSGCLALLVDAAAVATAEGARALLLATAYDAAPYPSTPGNDWGFGGADLAAAWTCRASLAETSFSSGGSSERLFAAGAIAAGGHVALAWNRHVTWADASAPVTYSAPADLDLYVYDGATGEELASSRSVLDTRERVTLPRAVTSAIVRVVRAGALPSGVTTEPFAVAAESASATTPAVAPPFALAVTQAPQFVGAGAEFEVRARVSVTGSVPLAGLRTEFVVPSGYSLAAGQAVQSVAFVAGGAADFAWTVRAPSAPEGPSEIQVRASSTAYATVPPVAQATVQVVLDPFAPSGTVSVAEGGITNTPGVHLGLDATDPGSLPTGVASMRIANDGEPFGAFEPWAPSVAWTLTSGDQVKTVRAQFRDRAGNLSAETTASVRLDTFAPTQTLRLEPGSPYLLPGTALAVAVEAQDRGTGSGVADYRVGTAFGELGAWLPLPQAAPLAIPVPPGVADAELRVYCQVRDVAGNASPSSSAGIHVLPADAADLALAKRARGATQAPGDADLMEFGYVAGDSLRISLKLKAASKLVPYLADADLVDAGGAVALTLHGDAAGKPAVATYERTDAAATGTLRVVVHSPGPASTRNGTYEIALKRRASPSNLRRSGETAAAAGVAEFAFPAAAGSALKAAIRGELSGGVELVAPDGTLRAAAAKTVRGGVNVAATPLAGSTGVWRLRVPASGTVAFSVTLSLRAAATAEVP